PRICRSISKRSWRASAAEPDGDQLGFGSVGPGPGRSDRIGPGRLAPGDPGDVGQRPLLEHAPHVLADGRPDREQHALALMVTGSVLVRLAEVAEGDGTVDGAHD